MNVPQIYIESTVFNFVFNTDSPEMTRDAVTLFELIGQGKFAAYTSQYVRDELEAAPEPKRSNMLALIDKYNIITLSKSPDAARLANIYIAEGAVPVNSREDAHHIATTAVKGLDYIVSYNFKHIVRSKTITMTGAINQRESYKPIKILSPTEVINYDKD
jgi:hypothetical protein